MIFLKCVMVRQYNIRMIRKENAMTCSVVITTEKTEKHFWYLAKDVVSGVASEGLTLDEALANLKEALQLYYEDMPNTPSQNVMFTTMEVSV